LIDELSSRTAHRVVPTAISTSYSRRQTPYIAWVSNVEAAPAEAECGGRVAVAAEPVHELMNGREVVLGTRGMAVTRTLPHRDRRMVGAWCFVDQYGPEDIATQQGMRLPPHPHTGLQTVTWLVAGDVLHRDSLDNVALIRPGQLNLMTAGRAIAHSEESPADHSPTLHGVQLWTALPAHASHVDPHFEHHPRLPVLVDSGVTATVLAGELGDAVSPARVYSPLVGADVALDSGADTRLPLRPDFEYAALGLTGSVDVDGVVLRPGPLLYLGSGRSELGLRSGEGGRVLLLGGEPFEERIVMWWNFVGASHDEIVQAREDWMAGRRFGAVQGFGGDRLPAPPMPAATLKPRGRLPG
jgi:redox-sensitive bicupin YhaK (pirin superfamily)